MIELNLLPDVKLDFVKAEKTRRLIFTASAVVAVSAIVILVGLIGVGLLQKKHISDLNNDIDKYSKELKGKPQIAKILTVQNQLQSLTTLHAQKPAASYLLDYLNQVTPASVSITTLQADFPNQKITITGSADNLSSVNQYVDTLKFTTYSTDTTNGSKAFNNVVLSSFGISGSSQAGFAGAAKTPTSYSITLSYDQAIFDITQKVKLVVPQTTTTRSAIDKPNDLFQNSTTSGVGGSN